MLVATKKIGSIGSAAWTVIGYKQSDRRSQIASNLSENYGK